jgi:hypothetical protein
MKRAALSLLFLGAAAFAALAAQAQSLLPDQSPTKGQEGQLDTSCGAWQKGRKTLNYYLMVSVAENYLRTSVESIQDKQGIGGDPMRGVGDKEITTWMDRFCGERPESSMQAGAEAYAKVLVEQMPASAKSEPRGVAPAAAGAGGEAAPAAKKRSSGFKIGRTCESWVNGRKGLDYFMMTSSSEDYLKGEVAALREARGVTRDPMQGVTDKDIARHLDEYCPRNLREPLERALDVYASALVGGSPVAQSGAQARSGEKAKTAEAPAQAGAAPAGAAGATPAPRKPSGFAVGRTCESWMTGRKGLDYYLLISKSEDYLKGEAAALAAERGVTKDPLAGVGSKEIAAWLDQYCAQRGKEPLETALNAYASELVGPGKVPPKAEARPSAPPAPAAPQAQAAAKPQAAPAAPAAPQAPREPAYLGGGRNCAAWSGGRKGQEYYNLIESSEAQLRNDVRVLRETRGLSFDPLENVSRKDIAAFLDGYCAERPKVPLESAVRVYANQLLSNR